MEAPEKCYDCDLGSLGPICRHSGYGPDKNNPTERLVPGPDCPFVQLAAKDAEIAEMRGELDELRLIFGKSYPKGG